MAFMSLAHLASTYVDTRKTSEEIFDKLLLTLALSISEHALASRGDLLPDDLLELIHSITNDNLYYKVIGPDNAFIVGYEDIVEPPEGVNYLKSNLEYYDAIYWEEPVRVISVSSLVDDGEFSGWTTTFVAQTINDRNAYVTTAMVDSAIRLIFLLIVMAILLFIGVNQGLRPLKKTASELHNREPRDLSLLREENLPVEIKGLVLELNNLFRKLTAQQALTKRFVENAAHQLRTPVTALLPQVELAHRHADSERERNRLAKVKNSAEHIARLTTQLLNLTYAEAMRDAKPDFTVFNLEKICVRQVRRFRERSEIDLKLHLQPARIKGTELQLEEMLENLLDNALKYAGNSPITLSTFTAADESILEVKDEGIGIEPKYRQRVKERFFRVASHTQGTGLGLAIAEEIMLSHQGKLEIDAGPEGKGTIIRCRFPTAN